jgi:peptidoglycan/xylan/chitin deacetylase (PgdA/CDA1 family)
LLYNEFLKKYAFNLSDKFKDSLKLSYTGFLPKRNYHGRVLYYHYVFPENYENFVNQIRFYEQLGISSLQERHSSKYVITFDDTYRLNIPIYEYLRANDIAVTLFISPKAIVDKMDIYHGSKLPQLTLNDLAYLVKLGVDIQNHTYSHGHFTCSEELIKDAKLAQAWLKTTLGITSEYLSLPRGELPTIYEQNLRDLSAIGIKKLVTTNRYKSNFSFEIGRQHVMPHWPITTLEYFLGN